jgi:ferric-dicitrate binding protein FerR (iron transport regulator)
MENDDRIDDRIRTLVRSVGRPVPKAVEERLTAATAERVSGPGRRLGLRPLLAVSALAGIAALALAIWTALPAIRREPPREIAEIRTEFVLPDKNITIIFVQKPDFPELVTAY